MKAIWYLPLAFLAGQHGFALFAPYLAFFLTVTAAAVMGWLAAAR